MLYPPNMPLPPARAPAFPPFPTSYPPIGRAPAWMDSAQAADEGRGILGQFSRPFDRPRPGPWRQFIDPPPAAPPIPLALSPMFPAPPSNVRPYQGAPSWQQTASPPGSISEPHAMLGQPSNQPLDYSMAAQFPPMNDPSMPPKQPAMSRSDLTSPLLSAWDPNGPSLWHEPAAGNVEFPVPAAIDGDPFARAARRIRQAVRSPEVRPASPLVRFLANYAPHVVEQLLSLPERNIKAAGDLQRTGEYDPAPAVETATLMVGTPLTPAGALGSAARRPPRLPMDEASRMARADAMGFRRDMPVEYAIAPAGEKIKSAAIDINGRIFEAPMHYKALEDAEREFGLYDWQMPRGPIPEGYVTNADRYVSRAEAGDIARRADQTGESGQFGRELASEETKMSKVKPSSKVYTGATAPGLPGGEGPWGWVVPDKAASAPASPLGHRTQQFPASDMGISATQASQGAANPHAPIWHRSERPMSIDARGVGEGELQASLTKAWEQGFDSVTLRNYTAPGGRTGDILVVKDLAQLRDPRAKFDLAKRDSNDLLASIAALLGIGAATHTLGDAPTQVNDEVFRNALRRGDAL
jgi:hypothetical protein